MRAVLIKDGAGPAENLFVGEAEKPEISAKEVLVKIKAFGLNRMDILQRRGGYPLPKGASTILGVEFSGHVAEVGSEVTQWKVNDEVFGLAAGGAYAEFIAVRDTHLIPKPPHLSWVAAASILENWLTAYQAVSEIGRTGPGDSVLIHAGASGVGLAAAQLARFFGAKTVITTASTQEKLDFMLSLPEGGQGATHVVNYKTQDFAAEVKNITSEHGVDVIVDFVGQSHWQKNIDSLAIDGRMTLVAFLSGAVVEKVNLGPILYKRLKIQGTTLRSRTIEYQTDLISRFKKDVLVAFDDGRLRSYIHSVYPWTKIIEAHQEMEADKNIGKIICEVV